MEIAVKLTQRDTAIVLAFHFYTLALPCLLYGARTELLKNSDTVFTSIHNLTIIRSPLRKTQTKCETPNIQSRG